VCGWRASERGRIHSAATRIGDSIWESRLDEFEACGRSDPTPGRVVVGVAYLLNPVSYAEFTIYPKLVIMGNISQTVANISSHHGLFLTALFCYLINFIEDIIIAWGLYILLAPVNRALSLLAAWFQLILGGQFKSGHPWAVQNRPVATVLPGRSVTGGFGWLRRGLNLRAYPF